MTRHISHVTLRRDLRATEQRILDLQGRVGNNDPTAAAEVDTLTSHAERLRRAISDSAARAGQTVGWR